VERDALQLSLRGGVRIAVPRDRGTITTYVALEQEDWFEDEIRFVRAWMRPRMTVVDIGANFGTYTLAMARAVGNGGRVLAFEPAPSTAEYLSHSLGLNGFSHATLDRIAVSNREGAAAFVLGADPELAALGPADEGAMRVPMAPLDALLERHGLADADFVKIDVEGHELQVVEGGDRFFRLRSPLVMLEVRAGRQFDLQALRRLESLGYGAYRLVPGALMLEPWSTEPPADPYLLNLFACKAERAAELAEGGWLDLEGRSSKLKGLKSANTRAFEALNQRMCLPRLLTFARGAWELGARAQAVTALEHALQALQAQPGMKADEPFRAPLPIFDGLPAGSAGAGWLACAVIESYERLRFFSSIFAAAPLAALEDIRAHAAATPQVERRLQLRAMLEGRQEGPLPSPKLRGVSEENLNPEFWCGESGAG
jgi:FkbM family methyltransferase